MTRPYRCFCFLSSPRGQHTGLCDKRRADHEAEQIEACRASGHEFNEAGEYCDSESCPACCEHGDLDGGQCLDCGSDLTEDLSAEAYDRAKDARKYGDC